ncbi:low molecular weight phosphotyrosine phosphatase [Chlorella sorokiniana]|uniref:Low molecular weight phosphotyrosine phosphatase n=1 Tax=Chlorella sorokiniana TaxID=3076 RepID=A0A2P6TBV6_CHLSO|nr:low molecular weight phosphotyrosine phosphatase [Chlorella sorokiniana]|eukprot:PRW18373.1 low molecular weight phosphotyrosine phosphatase [Chlorella sorokiniana]
MTATARKRGVNLTSRSRPLRPQDLTEFDYIIGMDDSNLAAIRRAAEYWRQNGEGGAVPADYASKLSLMTDYLRDAKFSRKYSEVPDPYYGGASGFELVLDLLDDACEGLLERVNSSGKQQ